MWLKKEKEPINNRSITIKCVTGDVFLFDDNNTTTEQRSKIINDINRSDVGYCFKIHVGNEDLMINIKNVVYTKFISTDVKR